jgi:hypothetical protein
MAGSRHEPDVARHDLQPAEAKMPATIVAGIWCG